MGAINSYGLPFRGSKSKLAAFIIGSLPASPVLYDLFGGGGAVTHAAVLSGKFARVVYNDIRPLAAEGFSRALAGDFPEIARPRWVSRADFKRDRSSDVYTAACFSFGHNWRSYMYNAQFEAFERALFYGVCFDDWAEAETRLPKGMAAFLRHAMRGQADWRRRRLELRRCLAKSPTKIKQLLPLEALERISRLRDLPAGRVTVCNADYRDVPLTDEGVIYCDIPYRGGEKYDRAPFDYERFYDWAARQELPVFISEYTMPEPRFVVVAGHDMRRKFHRQGSNLCCERIFTPRHQVLQGRDCQDEFALSA